MFTAKDASEPKAPKASRAAKLLKNIAIIKMGGNFRGCHV